VRLELGAAPLVALVAATLSAVAHVVAHRTGRRFPRRVVLVVLVVLSATAYFNLFQFHGVGTLVHYHDVAHHYLGAKYYDEIDYADLYDATARADADLPPGTTPIREVRDLRTFHVRPVASALVRGEHIRERFSPTRWRGFVRDVSLIRRLLGPFYPEFLTDKGFNAPPFWALLAWPVASLVPSGSYAGFGALALIDVVLLVSAFSYVGVTFGVDALLCVLALFFVTFGAEFLWVGGGFFRQGWFVSTVVAATSLARRRYRLTGAALGLAALLRIFPALLIVPIAGRAVFLFARRRVLPRHDARVVLSFAFTVVCGIALTALLPRGFWHYRDWSVHMAGLSTALARNRVGLVEFVTYTPGDLRVNWSEYLALLDARAATYKTLTTTLAVPAALLVAAIARRSTALSSLSLGLPLAFVTLSLASYYYALVVVLALVLARRGSSVNLALLFAAEAATYAVSALVPDARLAYATHGAFCTLVTLFVFQRQLLGGFRHLRQGASLAP
jgi:hypothetical protein